RGTDSTQGLTPHGVCPNNRLVGQSPSGDSPCAFRVPAFWPARVRPFGSDTELKRRNRTTARGALCLLLASGLLAGTTAARGDATKPIIFPVLGAAHYSDDFGQPRAGGAHQGIDIVAAKRSLALAAEAGKIKFW